MKKLITIATALLFSSLTTIAAESKFVILEGKVKSFDNEKIRITTSKGDVTVPRNYVPNEIKIKANEDIRLPMTNEQLKAIQ